MSIPKTSGALAVVMALTLALGTLRPSVAEGWAFQEIRGHEAEAGVADAMAFLEGTDPRETVVCVADASGHEVTCPGGDVPVMVASLAKPFLVAAALEQGLDPEATFAGYTLTQLLEQSRNDASAELAAKLDDEALVQLFRDVGLAAGPAVEVPSGEPFPGAQLMVSARAVPAAFAVFANGGRTPDGRQVLSTETANTVLRMMESVVHGEKGTAQRAAVSAWRVAGKTGTAVYTDPEGSERTFGHFVGLVPAHSPDRVVFVSAGYDTDADTPRWGGVTAAPAFAAWLGAMGTGVAD